MSGADNAKQKDKSAGFDAKTTNRINPPGAEDFPGGKKIYLGHLATPPLGCCRRRSDGPAVLTFRLTKQKLPSEIWAVFPMEAWALLDLKAALDESSGPAALAQHQNNNNNVDIRPSSTAAAAKSLTCRPALVSTRRRTKSTGNLTSTPAGIHSHPGQQTLLYSLTPFQATQSPPAAVLVRWKTWPRTAPASSKRYGNTSTTQLGSISFSIFPADRNGRRPSIRQPVSVGPGRQERPPSAPQSAPPPRPGRLDGPGQNGGG